MAILDIIQLDINNLYDNGASLRIPSEKVIDFNEEFKKELEDILDTFYSWKIAVGISAPQVGIHKRISVINLNKEDKQNTLILINPMLISESGKKDTKKESCLSVPNLRGEVERREKIQITYQDRYGHLESMSAGGFLARVIMHEIDHLDGILYVDRLKPESKLEPLEIKWE